MEYPSVYANILCNAALAQSVLQKHTHASELLASALASVDSKNLTAMEDVWEARKRDIMCKSARGRVRTLFVCCFLLTCVHRAFHYFSMYLFFAILSFYSFISKILQVLGLISLQHLSTGSLMTAEGLIRSALADLDQSQNPHVATHIQYQHEHALILKGYGQMLMQWDKREREGEGLVQKAHSICSHLPKFGGDGGSRSGDTKIPMFLEAIVHVPDATQIE